MSAHLFTSIVLLISLFFTFVGVQVYIVGAIEKASIKRKELPLLWLALCWSLFYYLTHT